MEVNLTGTGIDFMKEAKRSLKQLPLTNSFMTRTCNTLTLKGVLSIWSFTCEKIEKVVLSAIKVHESGVTDETANENL
jgi:hypothetical protein